MKKLKIFLLMLLVFSIFIPKTYASEDIPQQNFLIDAMVYDFNGNFVTQYENAPALALTASFPVIYGFQINNLNFSKACDVSYTYRVDYTLWGWHNQNSFIKWVNYAKSINVFGDDISTIGTIITPENGYRLRLSTFFTWIPSYCPVDSINGLNFRVNDSLKTPINQNYFYDSLHEGNNNYLVYEALYDSIDYNTALSLVQDYYSANSITQEKLDSIEQKIVDTNEKLEDIQNELDDLYDNITNSDTSDSQNTANGFFNNFNTEDNGGLSAIVTAPLRAINSMVEGTCKPLTATWRGKTISLPCGTEFWDKMSPIRTFLNVIEGGIICYGILIDIYKMINRMKNPEDDRVDVMKL